MESARYRRRVAVQLPPAVGSKNQNESALRACAAGVVAEPGPGERATWDIPIGCYQSGLRTQIVLEHLGQTLATRGAENDSELAVWDAMCRLEKMLRERRVAVAADGRRSHAELLGAE